MLICLLLDFFFSNYLLITKRKKTIDLHIASLHDDFYLSNVLSKYFRNKKFKAVFLCFNINGTSLVTESAIIFSRYKDILDAI